MRGTPRLFAIRGAVHGIIPAYAGNTCGVLVHEMQHRDHPRICGEHYLLNARLTAGEGSSPHMRGTLFDERLRADGGGIIPAYAGNTLCLMAMIWASRDHPRICGEHLV